MVCWSFKSFAGFHTQNADVFHAVMAFGLGFWLNWCNHTVRTSQPPPVKTFCLLPNVSAICLVRRPLMGLAYFTKSFQFPFLILTHQNSTALHSVWIYPNLIKVEFCFSKLPKLWLHNNNNINLMKLISAQKMLPENISLDATHLKWPRLQMFCHPYQHN